MAHDHSAQLRQRRLTARNPHTPSETLLALAQDQSDIIRRCVAWNVNCPPDILAKLADDANPRVAYAAVKHPECPQEVLRAKAQSGDHLSGAVVSNSCCPPDILALLEQNEDLFVRKSVAAHPNASVSTLHRLAAAPQWEVRRQIALNAVSPLEVIMPLLEDRSWAVRVAAMSHPALPDHIKALVALGR